VAGKPDFAEVASAALDMAHVLLPEWLGGKKQGNEWIGESRANGGMGNSWCVNLTTGAFGHFSGDERGGDLISLYAALNHIKQGAALKEVAQQVGITERAVRVLDRSRPTEKPAEPIPLSAYEPKADPQLGQHVACYRYGTAFWVLRYEKDGQKEFRPLTWRNGGWARIAYPEPRPLYNLTALEKEPTAPVIIVEGEKAADALAGVMGAYVVMTWANGASAVHKNDWAPLKGRDVIIWPDADEPGTKAAAAVVGELIKAQAIQVRVISVADRANGWDAADAVGEGWGASQIAQWTKGRTRVVFPREEASLVPEITDAPVVDPDTGNGALVEAGELDDSAPVSWASLGLDTTEGGYPHATVANGSLIIQTHPRLKGKVWHDEFTDKIYTSIKGGAPRQWSDSDDIDLTVYIQQSMRLHKFKIDLISHAVNHAARANARNSLTDWLDSLKWDGIQRLETWLADCLGVEHNEYSMAIAVNWPISMVARAYRPGCKVDTMPVLEGPQGMSKSTFLEVLGDPWYGSIPVAFGDKDFLQAIQGRWLVEIPDMTGFSKREHTQILATITIRSDIYRASYGRHTVEHPRVAIFAATSETDDYLQDARGRRRYWPLRCIDIDIDALRGLREQVFAEACERYREGAKWYEMPGSADLEQSARATPDLWSDKVLDYCNELWEGAKFTRVPLAITSSRILSDAIDMPLAKQDDGAKKRVARILRENHWIQKRDMAGRLWKKIERS
jgi:putative DNA primase/helicase